MKVVLNGLQAGNRSGTGHYTAQLARWLPGMSDDVEVTVLWPKAIPIPQGVADPEKTFILKDTASSIVKRLLFDQFGVRQLQYQLDADLVHYPASVGAQLDCPDMSVTVHDLSFMRNPEWFRWDRVLYYRATVGRSAKWARRIIADSQATATDLREKLGVRADRIDVIPLGVDDTCRRASKTDQDAARAKYGLPERFVLYLGTVEPRKNIPRLIEAWFRTANSHPVDLVIAGRDGWKVGPIHEAAEKSPLAQRIRFVGFVDPVDLPALYSCAEALVWPSLWEGFGLPPLEAMACGVPVLTSNVSSMPEFTGSAAMLVDPYNVDAIADGMLRLLNDASLRENLIQKGLAQAAQFTWRRTAELTLESYRAAVNE